MTALVVFEAKLRGCEPYVPKVTLKQPERRVEGSPLQEFVRLQDGLQEIFKEMKMDRPQARISASWKPDAFENMVGEIQIHLRVAGSEGISGTVFDYQDLRYFHYGEIQQHTSSQKTSVLEQSHLFYREWLKLSPWHEPIEW